MSGHSRTHLRPSYFDLLEDKYSDPPRREHPKPSTKPREIKPRRLMDLPRHSALLGVGLPLLTALALMLLSTLPQPDRVAEDGFVVAGAFAQPKSIPKPLELSAQVVVPAISGVVVSDSVVPVALEAVPAASAVADSVVPEVVLPEVVPAASAVASEVVPAASGVRASVVSDPVVPADSGLTPPSNSESVPVERLTGTDAVLLPQVAALSHSASQTDEAPSLRDAEPWPGRKVYAPQPGYPSEAREAGLEGLVIAEALVDTEGRVEGTRLVNAAADPLAESALKSLAAWRFEPREEDGRVLPFRYRVAFRFALEPAETPEPLAVAEGIEPPERLLSPLPDYPHGAWAQGVEGDVLIKATIDTQGRVAAVEVLKGLPYGLTEAAVSAVRQWKFRPAMRFGKPVAVYHNLSVRFTL